MKTNKIKTFIENLLVEMSIINTVWLIYGVLIIISVFCDLLSSQKIMYKDSMTYELMKYGTHIYISYIWFKIFTKILIEENENKKEIKNEL